MIYLLEVEMFHGNVELPEGISHQVPLIPMKCPAISHEITMKSDKQSEIPMNFMRLRNSHEFHADSPWNSHFSTHHELRRRAQVGRLPDGDKGIDHLREIFHPKAPWLVGGVGGPLVLVGQKSRQTYGG